MSSARLLFQSTTLLTRSGSKTQTTSGRTSTHLSNPHTLLKTPLDTQKSSFHASRSFASRSSTMANRTVESQDISEITNREKTLTGQDDPVKGGPTAQAQRHVHDRISSGSVISDIAKGEEAITHNGAPVAGGPAAAAQSQAAQARNEVSGVPAKALAKGSLVMINPCSFLFANNIHRRETTPRSTPGRLTATQSQTSTPLKVS